MAVLWEQRNMVRVLRRLEDEELKRLPYEDGGMTLDQQVHHTYANPQGYAMWENVLIKEMLKIQKKEETDIPEIRILQRLLNSCIKDGYIAEVRNTGFSDALPPFVEKTNPNGISSKRRIQITDDKGVEILNKRYFWFKFIPEAFPDPAKIVVSISITILTAIATTLFVVFRLN